MMNQRMNMIKKKQLVKRLVKIRLVNYMSFQAGSKVTVINPVMVIISTLLEEAHETEWPDINIPGLPEINFNDIIDLVLGLIAPILDAMTNCGGAPDVNGFCDDMWLTATPDNMIFQGSHSGMITALNEFLHNKQEGLPSLLWPALLLIFSTLQEQGIIGPDTPPPTLDQCADLVEQLLNSLDIPPLIDLENGSFGFFKGTNATKSWWKINSGKYDMNHYNEVLEFNGMSKLPDSWW